jgi:hypothetical protein
MDNLKEFCKQYQYDWMEVKMMIDEYYYCNCHCDCYILQATEVIGIQPTRRRMHGFGMLKHFPDECYEKLAKK